MDLSGLSPKRIVDSLPSFFSSIKGRVVVAVSLLVIVGLLASDIVGIIQLRSYLSNRIDDQITSALKTTSRIARGQRLGIIKTPTFRTSGPSQIHAPSPVLIVIYSPSGSINFVRYNQLGSLREPQIPSFSSATAMSVGNKYFVLPPSSSSGDPFRAKLQQLPGDEGAVLVAVSLDELDSTISHLGLLDAVVGAVVLLALVVLTYLAVWLGMRPLISMEETTDAIAQGELSLRIDTSRSASEIKKLGTAFNYMLERIQLAFVQIQDSERRSKSSQDQLRRFVADAGHELRTPLTSILGYSELLQSGIDSNYELVQGASRRIQQESVRMSGLVEELLLLARLDQRKPLKFEMVDLLSLVADGVQDARVIQPERDISLHPLDGNSDGSWLHPVYVLGDEESLRQVISNLINNALFHTERDIKVDVRVGISRPGDSDGSGTAVLEVEDFGQGIRSEALEHLFERFYRVDDNRGYDHGGFGLGLSVVDSVINAHDGRVVVDSVEGKGTCFRIEIPAFSGVSGEAVSSKGVTKDQVDGDF